MEGSKDLARDMLSALKIDDDGFILSFAKGVISYPTTMYYLGYDFIDTDNRSANFNDRERIFKLIKKGLLKKDVLLKVVNVFIKRFVDKVDVKNIAIDVAGSFIGKAAFNEMTGIKLGAILSQRLVASYAVGILAGGLLTFGAETSRSIYTSRSLKFRNPRAYEQLRQMGDLDLLYYLVENKVKPFEKAEALSSSDPVAFKEVCHIFFNGCK
jgi:hypothetical protein